uniref:Mitochondrial import inner membrane translocase subunit TIM22 n=1 Tax=Phaeocystis antarctica TaxID=33657 RepID=A0A7S0E8Y0_9EUKA
MAAPEQQQEKKKTGSCLGRTVGSLIDGGVFGGAIGSLMATGPAFSQGLFNGGLRILLRSGLQSAVSVGGFMATYNGGICSLESMRSKRDVVNPFLVGGLIGVAGAIPGFVRPLPTAPWAYKNPRALVGSGLGSAMLCSFFWMLSAGGLERQPATAPAAEPAAAERQPVPVPAARAPPASQPTQPADAYPQYDSPVETQAVEMPGFADGLAEPHPPVGFAAAPLAPANPGLGADLAPSGSEQISDPWAAK